MNTLLPEQVSGLAARFRHFDLEAAAALFHPDQTGTSEVKGREYPAVLMRNGVRWHYNRDRRPDQKSMAPPGPRTLLTDDPALGLDWHVVVEGEADAVAVASLGQRGVACVGGTSQAEALAPLFGRKKLYLLFDGDDPGRQGARQFAMHAMNAGADVYVARLPEGLDPEEWLNTFDSREQALGELQRLLGSAERVTADEIRQAQHEQDEADGFETRTAWTERLGQSLLVTVFEPDWDLPRLAVYGPSNVGEPVGHVPYPGQPADEDEATGVARGWRIMDEGLRMPDARVTFRPGGRDGMLDLVQEGSLIVPPQPFRGTVDSTQLWDEVVEFFSTWLYAPAEDHHLLTAFVFACWRLEDAKFQKAPFLRIHGASNSGKTRTIELVHMVGNFSMYATLTPNNVHRVVESFREFTLCWDEFNMENMSQDARKELVNIMNLSQARQSRALRMSPGQGPGADMIVRAYRLFGPKVFAGYLDSEDDGFRRRTIEIDLGKVQNVPEGFRWPQLPKRAHEDARTLRGRLLAWRVQQLERGAVDPEQDPAVSDLRDLKITGMTDAYWPLFHVLPPGHAEARSHLSNAVVRAEATWGENKAVKAEAFVLEHVGEMLRRSAFRWYSEGGTTLLLSDLHAHIQDAIGWADVRRVGAILRQLGLKLSRDHRVTDADGNRGPRSLALVLTEQNWEQLNRAAKAHGVILPPEAQVRSAPTEETGI